LHINFKKKFRANNLQKMTTMANACQASSNTSTISSANLDVKNNKKNKAVE